MDLPWKHLPDLPDLPDMSGLSNIDLPDLPNLNALGSLAAQLQTLISSAIAHPFWAIVLVLLSITLIQIVADLIKRSLKAFLTLLLKLPLLISQWIWKRTVASTPTDSQLLSRAEQADQLIAQLETLRQEQDTVIAALKTLLHQPTSHSASQPASRSSMPQPLPEPANLASPSLQTPEPPPESQIPLA